MFHFRYALPTRRADGGVAFPGDGLARLERLIWWRFYGSMTARTVSRASRYLPPEEFDRLSEQLEMPGGDDQPLILIDVDLPHDTDISDFVLVMDDIFPWAADTYRLVHLENRTA